jgi:hypothetical protein
LLSSAGVGLWGSLVHIGPGLKCCFGTHGWKLAGNPVLFWGRVEIVEARGTWVRIAAVEQPSRKDKRCYPGWIYGSNVSSYRYVRPAFVTEDISRAYGDPEATQNRAPCFSGAGSIFLAILAAWPA